MTFQELDLDDTLCHAVADMGFDKPTSIQSMVIPQAMDGRDIMASAPTGTGKTAAFLLPACQFLLDYPRKEPGSTRVLILTPTRELAIQVFEQAKAITAHTDLVCGVITGGINYGTDRETLNQNLDILVATPGRLHEHIRLESADCRNIECLILDEADRMLDMGFANIVNQIAAEARWRKQNMLFSATLEGKGVKTFATEILNDPAVFEASPSRKEKAKIFLGLGLMQEIENYNLEINNKKNLLRSTNYLSSNIIINDKANWVNTVYFQVASNDQQDYRMLYETGFEFNLSQSINFTFEFNFRYDSQPHGDLGKTYYNLKNGIIFRF